MTGIILKTLDPPRAQFIFVKNISKKMILSKY